MTDEDMRHIERLLARHARAQRNGFARGVLNLSGDGHKMQSSQVELLDGEIVDGAERAQNYGVTSHPQPGAEVFVAFVGSDRGHAIVLAVDDRRYRVQSLAPGEVCIYTDEGDTITLKRDRKIEVRTLHLDVEAVEDVAYRTKKFSVEASESFDVKTASTHIATDALSFTSQGGGEVTAQMTGTLAASADVTSNAGAVSLNSHAHEGVQSGGDTSQKPVGGK